MRESTYQNRLIKKIEQMFEECIVLKNNPNHLQGVPDLLLLFPHTWAALEVKLAHNSEHQPNQDYYVAVMDGMSFAAFIYPENDEEVLYELQQALTTRRTSRVS